MAKLIELSTNDRPFRSTISLSPVRVQKFPRTSVTRRSNDIPPFKTIPYTAARVTRREMSHDQT